MPIQFVVKEKKIYAEILFQIDFFDEVVALYKKYKCQYHPSSHAWIIPPAVFEDLKQELEKKEKVIILPEDEKEIQQIKNPPPTYQIEKIPFLPSELKVPPIEGKPPYQLFQLEDIIKCVNRNRFALFNEQGTGKSYIIISVLDILRRKKGLKKILFITSPSGVFNIKKEIEKFSDFNKENIIIGGVKCRRPFDNPKNEIIICNYRSFLLISDEYHKLKQKTPSKHYRTTAIPIQQWLQGDPGAIVLDESHFIANPKARQTKAIHLIAPFFYYRYILTGTPADKEEKYYSQLKFLDPALVKYQDYYTWLQEYAYLGGKFSEYEIKGFKPQKLKELQTIVANICVRRFAKDCLTLPDHYIKPIYVEWNDLQKEIYKMLVIEKLKALGPFLPLQTVINTFQYLLLAVDNPELLLMHEEKLSDELQKAIIKFSFKKHHSKIDTLLDVLEEHPKEKIVIWTAHPSVGFYLKELLHKYNPLVLNGQVSLPKNQTLDQYKAELVRTFQTDSRYKIFIAGIQTLNTSVSLSEASIQIFFDTTFNYTEYNQALFRIHRIGQTKPVNTYSLIIDESLDVIRYNSLRDKDFINSKFLTKEYLDKKTAEALFLAVGTA